MSEQPLDLRKCMQIIRRHWRTVVLVAVLGAVAGGGYAQVKPPPKSSAALVAFPFNIKDISSQVVIVTSNEVLKRALPDVHPSMSLQTLQGDVKAKEITPDIVSIGADGKTAAQAENIANAVAASFMAYVGSDNSAAGKVPTRLLQSATSAAGLRPTTFAIIASAIGALLGALIGAIGVLASGRRDRRLRLRDQIADAIGVPVLASLAVRHPSTAADWAKLLDAYQPSNAAARRLHNALHYLGLSGPLPGRPPGACSITVLSLSTDKRALALGPQLAVFAASQGIRTALVIGPQQDTNVAAALHTACAAQQPTRRSGHLQVAIAGPGSLLSWPDAGLIIAVAVVNGNAPAMGDLLPTNATVLGVSAGAVSAEQLALISASAGAHGRHIDGILVADPYSSDPTTGRIPQLGKTRRVQPTRLTSVTMGTEQ
jgi:capsular polysaccharide biosynthesis protein